MKGYLSKSKQYLLFSMLCQWQASVKWCCFSSFLNERGLFLWRAKFLVFFFTRPLYLAHSQQDILESLWTAKRTKLFLFFYFLFIFGGAKLTKLSLFKLHFAGHVSHGIWLWYPSHFFSIVLLPFTRPQKIWHTCLHSLIEMIEFFNWNDRMRHNLFSK